MNAFRYKQPTANRQIKGKDSLRLYSAFLRKRLAKNLIKPFYQKAGEKQNLKKACFQYFL
jgi:hypothetical protein